MQTIQVKTVVAGLALLCGMATSVLSAPDPLKRAQDTNAPQTSTSKSAQLKADDTAVEVPPFHWSRRAVSELRTSGVIPMYEDKYVNLETRALVALNIMRGIEFSLLDKPAPDGRCFPTPDPQTPADSLHGANTTLWPEEARLLLRLIRAYRADIKALWTQSGRATNELNDVERRLVVLSKNKPLLQTPVASFEMSDVPVEEVVTTLTQRYHVPLSLIETADTKLISVQVQKGTARDVIAQILAQQPAYQLRFVNNRPVLLPRETRWNTVIIGPEFADVPRLQAKDRYTEWLQKNVPEFAQLYAPTFVAGNINAPIFTEPITMQGRTTVLQRFVQMLGHDPRAYFLIHRHTKLNSPDIALYYTGLSPLAVDEVMPGTLP